mmetsp:Transcript_35116/g.52198  ORF Transcript_35116/g.52198 Transcript_35116/m.52198 type:complete len:114 (-) Transcript_35116:366-707(-)
MAHLLEEVPSNFPLRAAPGRFIYIMGDEDIPYVDEMLKDMCVMDYVHWSPYVDPQNRPEPWYNVQFKDFILSHVRSSNFCCRSSLCGMICLTFCFRRTLAGTQYEAMVQSPRH